MNVKGDFFFRDPDVFTIADVLAAVVNTTGDIQVGVKGTIYFGDEDTNGSWRIRIDSGDSLSFERREFGDWVVKTAMTP